MWASALTAIALLSTADAVDPIEGTIKDFGYIIRNALQQALQQFSVTRLGSGNSKSGDFAFQTDRADPFRCPLCQRAPWTLIRGTWQIVLWSRNFRLTTMSDLNGVIDRLSSSRPIYTQRSLVDMLLAEPAEFRCPQITGCGCCCPQILCLNLVNKSEGSTKYELDYFTLAGRRKSIVGEFESVPDGSLFWRIAPTLSTRLCVAFTSITNQTSDETDFIVLNQIDSWPSCSNFIAIARSRLLVNDLRDFLEQQRVEGAFNSLEKVLCPFALHPTSPPSIPTPSLELPIELLPDDPFALPASTSSPTSNSSTVRINDALSGGTL